MVFWRGWRGSNPRPSASEADTLSTELQPLGDKRAIIADYTARGLVGAAGSRPMPRQKAAMETAPVASRSKLRSSSQL